jgi:23S rRNA (guanosine2251-2'-O)-methyltransferase
LVLPSVARSAAGACEYLRIAVNCSSNQYVKIALEEGYQVVALDGAGKNTLEEVQAVHPAKLLLVVGGEDSGVGQFIKMNANYVCAIPQSGHVNSLNASVAAALALYALRS